MRFDSTVTSVERLRELYRPASKTSLAKQLDHLDPHCRTIIDHAPFVVVATADASGRCDVSPKGGPPGFVRTLDEHRLAMADLSGNNRLDSMENLLTNPGIGLLFCVPGRAETLRVNGRASITTDPMVLEECTVLGVRPSVAIGVVVEEAYIHCGKALRRSGLWRPETWPDLSDLPSAACMLHDHYGLPGMDREAVERRLADAYGPAMWHAGGRADG